MGRAWSLWADGGQAKGLSTGCPWAERGPKGDPHIHAQNLHGVGTQNGPRYTLRFCRAFDGAHLAKRSERGGWRIGIGPEVIAGEIDMLPTER